MNVADVVLLFFFFVPSNCRDRFAPSQGEGAAAGDGGEEESIYGEVTKIIGAAESIYDSLVQV